MRENHVIQHMCNILSKCPKPQLQAENASATKSFMPKSLNYTTKSLITSSQNLIKGNKTLRIMTLSLMTHGKETLCKITAK